MKSKMLKFMAVFLSLFLIGYAGYQAWVFFYTPYKTEIAVNYSVNEAIHVDGIAIRTETVIEDQYGGSVSYKLSIATLGSMPKTLAVLAVSIATSASFLAAETVTLPSLSTESS